MYWYIYISGWVNWSCSAIYHSIIHIIIRNVCSFRFQLCLNSMIFLLCVNVMIHDFNSVHKAYCQCNLLILSIAIIKSHKHINGFNNLKNICIPFLFIYVCIFYWMNRYLIYEIYFSIYFVFVLAHLHFWWRLLKSYVW